MKNNKPVILNGSISSVDLTTPRPSTPADFDLLPYVLILMCLFVGPISSVISPLLSNIKNPILVFIFTYKYKYKINTLQKNLLVKVNCKSNTSKNTIGFVKIGTDVSFNNVRATTWVTIPYINSKGEVEYITKEYLLEDISVFEPKSLEYIIFKPLAVVWNELSDIHLNTNLLQQFRSKIAEAIKKLESVKVVLDDGDNYKGQLVQIDNTISKIEKLQVQQNNCIKRGLVALEIVKLDADSVDSDLFAIELSKQEIEDNLLKTKEFFNAYLSLKP